MRRLVICCDGTWNTPDQPSPTNVVKLARAVRPMDERGIAQIVFYDEGLGTGNFLDRLSGAFGDGLSKRVRDGYRFIVDNYENGDEIYLVGFSRGAFTARSIAGLIRKCGILQKIHAGRVREADQLYRKRDPSPDTDEARRFREAWAHPAAKIRCIAVWDTVGALGIPGGLLRSLIKGRYEFHDVQLSSRVENAFQALAIDEKRPFFKPTLWTTRPDAQQRVEQVWFAGVHSNVGGGYPDSGASDCALRWMIDCLSSCGLSFAPESLSALRPNALAPLNESRRGWYLLFPPHSRTIGAMPDEAVHASARERHEQLAAYRPANLVAYLAKQLPAIPASGTPRLAVSGGQEPALESPTAPTTSARRRPPTP
jgi:hypothetical protein